METLYRKVVIKSEADLPEIDGEYYALTKGGKFVNFTYSTRFPDHMLARIDWYLLEQDQQAETHTDFYDKYSERKKDKLLGEVKQDQQAPEKTDERIMKLVNALDGMDEYEQITLVRKWVSKYTLRSEQRQEISDEDVKQWVKDNLGHSYLKIGYHGWSIGFTAVTALQEFAKWIRDKIKTK